MADVAQDSTNDVGSDAQTALQNFDNEFSSLYHGGPIRSIADAQRYAPGDRRQINPFYASNGSGFQEQYRDTGTEPFPIGGHNAEQTHHFSAYLSMGINGRLDIYEAGQYGIRPNLSLPQPDNAGESAFRPSSVRTWIVLAQTSQGTQEHWEMDSVEDMYERRTWSLQGWSSMRTNTILRSFSFLGLFFAVVVGSLWLTSCRQRTSLAIEIGNPLRFVVSGPGTLSNFQVSGPDLEREPNRQGEGDRLTLLKVYWEIASSEGTDSSLDKIGPITYGKVPAGFVQIQPPNGVPPPPLIQHDIYNIRFLVNGGDGINRFFAIREGRIVAEGER